MDGTRFDAWARRLHSRRAIVPALAGLGVAVGFAPPTSAAPTGAQKGKHGKGRFGCANRDNYCLMGEIVLCPRAPSGFCAVDSRGKPSCIQDIGCIACKRNADCVAAIGPTAQCIKKCPFCLQSGVSTACLRPFPA